ncbi:MAG: 3-phosphoshikimate 1-carboxyvinyltransferase [Desulfobacterales bacterium]|jgi:3-phosphoshikimate 1-carboxyvinyltransferase
MKPIQSRPPIDATVRIPGSKSITHRALIAAGLAEGPSLLKDALICEDSLHTVDALRKLGVKITFTGDDAQVQGTGGRFLPSGRRRKIFLGNSGTSFRLLLSTVALAGGEYLLCGTPRMHERPIGGLVAALNRLGVKALYPGKKGYPPVLIRARGISGGKVVIPGNQSSQFVSSLLLAGPYAGRNMEIEIKGQLVSAPYVDLTLDVMEHFGVSVAREAYSYFKVPCHKKYRPCRFHVEGDLSSASYFWAAAAVTGGTVATENIHSNTSHQGDMRFLEILQKMRCYVKREPQKVTVSGRSLSGVDADMGTMPDMVPTLAAIALFAEGKTVIRNVAHLRFKESDRLTAVAMEWQRLGGHLEELPDGLIIHGGQKLVGTKVDSHDDHRLAMALAVIGLNVPGVEIKNPGSVIKSFPRFWDLWNTM